MKRSPLIVERVFDAPVSLVWKALTENNRMKHWYFDLEEFRAEVGFEFDFLAGAPEKKKFRHVCKVTEVEKEERLSYSWRYDGYDGESEVTFELFAEENGTRLRVTHAGLETFPTDVPELAAKNFEEGWNHILGISLKDYLANCLAAAQQ